MTFRAAGTSLSGQSLSDGLLVDIARHWRTLKVEDGGKQIRLQPGVIGARANSALIPLSSEDRARSGFDRYLHHWRISPTTPVACVAGVEQNAYHTLESMKFMLPSGRSLTRHGQTPTRSFVHASPSWPAAS